MKSSGAGAGKTRRGWAMKIKLLFGLTMVLLIILIISCAPAEEPVTNEAAEVKASGEEAPRLAEDPCENLAQANEDLTLLAEAIAEAENELEGLKIDLKFAQEDQTNVAEAEGLIKEQEDYLAGLNAEMAELQGLIAEC